MQRLFRRLFDDYVRKYFTALAPTMESPEIHITLSSDELNALRYACGYVAHKGVSSIMRSLSALYFNLFRLHSVYSYHEWDLEPMTFAL